MAKNFTNRPNFLGSEVGLVRKTFTIPANYTNYVVEDGKKIVKAGTIFTSPYYGLLFEDREVGQEASMVIGGRYIDANLPVSASTVTVQFIAQGLYNFTEGTVVRPNFGTKGMSAISAPSVSVSGSAISWTAVSNAKGYNVYDSEKAHISTVSGTSYTASAKGTYYIQTKADNINLKSSNLVVATVTTL